MHILALETSCDETGVAIIKNGQIVRSNIIRSSLKLHQKYGGVVPEIAAREHVKIIIPALEIALTEAKITWEQIKAIAVTVRPGLIGSLLIGINTARVLAEIKNKPLIEVDHIHGHIYSNWLTNEEENLPKPEFPIMILTVSGGHNDLILMTGHHQFEIVGESIDDAAGEAFDKVAKILGLPYPGGPTISKAAENGNPQAYDFPRSWLDKEQFDFSFSGLKTAVLYKVQEQSELTEQIVNDVSASFQEAVCDVLSTKLIKAAQKYQVREIHLAGGVSANTRLRELIKQKIVGSEFTFRHPTNLSFCTDNAAMIGSAGYFQK